MSRHDPVLRSLISRGEEIVTDVLDALDRQVTTRIHIKEITRWHESATRVIASTSSKLGAEVPSLDKHAAFDENYVALRTTLGILKSLNAHEPKTKGQPSADVVILTVLTEEYGAVCDNIADLKAEPRRKQHPDLYAWKIGKVTCTDGAYSVAIGMIGRAGTTKSAMATLDAVERWHPRYIFFVGIAGGLKELEKGDVIIADAIYDYEYGKIEKAFKPRDRKFDTDIGLLNGAVGHARSPDWRRLIRAQPPTACVPKVIEGEIASGDKVVDDPTNAFFREVLKKWPKIKAVEMEGAGVGDAIAQAQAKNCNVGFMMIRGVSDVPRPHRPKSGGRRGTRERDAWKEYAASSAAAFTVSLIAAGLPLPPADR